ncbi:thiamine pyrophosphate-binding protein [Rhodococcus sp. T2V]|uniref:thiamine pyrophosphate-binding protein n=1 Tax=Rhodococcus sp. T2V TaxID=3034164 RepID=UPI0023E33899|nr:thiamine pyrophosphate-binding protein [Rhodococcus sp. T2V]MDF3310576.1 thiamine pyrophosphate-binding protein [Rhodococcus sp. T2V]
MSREKTLRQEDKLDGGRAVARALSAAGVTTAFTLHGGHLDPIYYSCLDHGIELVDVRHESSAGHAAEGWARLSKQIGVAMVTSGPGLTNVVTSIANAYIDGTPVLYLAGSPPLRESGLNVMQGGYDQVAMVRPITKHALQVTDATRIEDQIATAITIATSGRPGPVFVELPIDVLVRPCPEPASPRRPVVPAPSVPRQQEVDATVAILEEAARPVLVLGNLARYEATPEQVNSFIATTGIPVVSSGRALGLADPDAPEYAHTLDVLATAAATGVGSADAALVVGSKFGFSLGGRSGSFLPLDCTVVHVYAEAHEMSYVRPPTVGSTANCGEFLDAVARSWRSGPDSKREWCAALASTPAATNARFEQDRAEHGHIHPFHAAQKIIESCPRESIWVLDGGESTAWAQYLTRTTTPGGVLSYGQQSCLGTGMGMALGAAKRYPDRPVIQIAGDGALGLHLQEFDTFVRHGANVITIVMNNGIWGMSIHGQHLLYGDDYNCVTNIPGVGYAEAARGLGCYAEDVDSLDGIAPAIKRALDADRPACINVAISPSVVSPVTTLLIRNPKDGDIAVPYYEHIPSLDA